MSLKEYNLIGFHCAAAALSDILHAVMRVSFSLLWRQLDHVINSQYGNGGLGGELEALHFGYSRLKHSTGFVVSYFSFKQI